MGRREIVELFWNKVDTTGECWVWTAGKYKTGYGKFNDGPRCVLAHRWWFEWWHGPVPPGLVVMHVCDNRACVRPTHLKLGTQHENIADMVAKNRHTRNRTVDTARFFELQAAGLTQRAIAEKLGLSQGHVSDVLGGQRRKHG